MILYVLEKIFTCNCGGKRCDKQCDKRCAELARESDCGKQCAELARESDCDKRCAELAARQSDCDKQLRMGGWKDPRCSAKKSASLCWATKKTKMCSWRSLKVLFALCLAVALIITSNLAFFNTSIAAIQTDEKTPPLVMFSPDPPANPIVPASSEVLVPEQSVPAPAELLPAGKAYSEPSKPKVPDVDLRGNNREVNGINLVFTPGIHGAMREKGTILTGNVSVELVPDETRHAKVTAAQIPEVKADAGWDFVGWRIDLVPRLGLEPISWIDSLLYGISSEVDFLMNLQRKGIYTENELLNFSFPTQYRKVYRITAEYRYSPKAPKAYIEEVLLADRNMSGNEYLTSAIVATGDRSRSYDICAAAAVVVSFLIVAVHLWICKRRLLCR